MTVVSPRRAEDESVMTMTVGSESRPVQNPDPVTGQGAAPVSAPEGPAPGVGLEASDWTGLLTAFDRLFSIGVLYPAGHARCIDVATAFQQELHRALAGASVLAIDATHDALVLQRCPVSADFRCAKRLHQAMAALGISRLEIDAAAAPGEIYTLVSLLLRLKHEAETTRGFRCLEFEGLPPAIRLTLRQFSQRPEGASGEPGSGTQPGGDGQLRGGAQSGDGSPPARAPQPATSAGVGVLELRGLGAETREAVGDLVQRISLHVAGQSPSEMAAATGPEDAALAGEAGAAIGPGGPAATGPASGSGAGSGSGSAPAATAETRAGIPIAPEPLTSPESLAALGSELPWDGTRIAPPCAEKAADQDCRLTLEELRRRLDAGAAGEAAPRLSLADRAEQLGIMAQLLSREPSPSALESIDDLLGLCFAEALRERELKVLAGALCEPLDGGDENLSDAVLPHLLRQLRGKGALGPLLLKAVRIAPLQAAGWPHLLNELLLGLEQADDPTFQELALAAAHLPAEQMRESLPRLARLEAMRESRLSPRLFRNPARELGPLHAVLLGSPLEIRIGPWLLEMLRAHPPAWAGAPALIALGEYAPGHRVFLARLLHENARGELSAGLLKTALQIVARSLMSLPRSRRGAAWVPKAVRALGALPTPAGIETLAAIRRERRLLVLHAWPPACRDVAAQALRAARGALETSPSDPPAEAPELEAPGEEG